MHPVEDQTICKSIEKKHATFKTPPNGKMLDNKGLLSKTHLDPKLVQVAQLFVQDLINRARLEVQRKNPEQVITRFRGTFFNSISRMWQNINMNSINFISF